MNAPTPLPSAPLSGREPMLDLWRGLALVDMAWVHLANHPIGMPPLAAQAIGEHTRFAAGCLVLLSGMTIGHVFGPALGAGGERRRATTWRLLKRALLLALVGRVACIAYVAIDAAMRGFPDHGAPMFAEASALARFVSPGVTGGLLLLYSLLLVAVPPLERFRAAFGSAATMGASLAVFAAAQWIGVTAQWPPWVFPLPHWQPLFVAGYLAAPHCARLLAADDPALRRSRLAVSVTFALVFAVRTSSIAGLHAAEAGVLGAVVFRKVPLSGGELAWYAVASAFVLSWSAWLHQRSDGFRRATAWLGRLGRWSLLVYVAHLLMEPPVLMLVDVLRASPWARAAMLPAMAAAMSGVAIAAERFDALPRRRGDGPSFLDFLREAVPASGLVGGGVAAGAMASVLLLATLPAMTAPGTAAADFAEAGNADVPGDSALQESGFEDSGFEYPGFEDSGVERIDLEFDLEFDPGADEGDAPVLDEPQEELTPLQP